jgi:quinol monooxygenase YgiN
LSLRRGRARESGAPPDQVLTHAARQGKSRRDRVLAACKSGPLSIRRARRPGSAPRAAANAPIYPGKEITMAITVIAKLKVKAGSEADFEAAAREMIAKVAGEAGTMNYILHKDVRNPTNFVYYEVYQDQAALDAHGKTDHMKAFGGKIGALLDGRPEITVLSEIAHK